MELGPWNWVRGIWGHRQAVRDRSWLLMLRRFGCRERLGKTPGNLCVAEFTSTQRQQVSHLRVCRRNLLACAACLYAVLVFCVALNNELPGSLDGTLLICRVRSFACRTRFDSRSRCTPNACDRLLKRFSPVQRRRSNPATSRPAARLRNPT